MLTIRSLFLSLLIIAFFSSCKKDKNILGNNVQPTEDGLLANTDDKQLVICYTKKYDSIASYNSRYKFIGCNQDPYFGYLNVGLYLNANLTVANWNFGNTARIDSAEIVLAISNSEFAGNGKAEAVLNYTVFMLDSTLYGNPRVYSAANERLHNKDSIISKCSVSYSYLNGKQVIRIPIDTNFAGRILRGTKYLTDNATFLSRYKGFYIKTSNPLNPEGTIYKCDLEDEISGFYLRYRTGGDSLKSFKFDFAAASAVKFNTAQYSYANADVNMRNQINGDTAAGSTNLFLKGMGVSKLRLLIPNLKNYADSFKVAVNRAELSLYIDDNYMKTSQTLDYSKFYRMPSVLSLIACYPSGKEDYTIDQTNTTDASRYDGGYDDVNKRYVFNIARHVQAILNGSRGNYGFYVVVADPSFLYTPFRDNYIERVVLAGSSNEKLRPRLSLTYIKFKNP